MDLSTVMTRINSHSYYSCAHFLKDVDLITNNCLEYNPDKDQFDRLLRTRACELRDTAHSLVYDVLDQEFEKVCVRCCVTLYPSGFSHPFFRGQGDDILINVEYFLYVSLTLPHLQMVQVSRISKYF